MGIIKFTSTIFQTKWRSTFSTLTQLRNNQCTNSRDLSKTQTASSWTSNAHNAKLSTPFSHTSKTLLPAKTANSFSPCQEVERPSSLSEPPGEERETEFVNFLYRIFRTTEASAELYILSH